MERIKSKAYLKHTIVSFMRYKCSKYVTILRDFLNYILLKMFFEFDVLKGTITSNNSLEIL